VTIFKKTSGLVWASLILLSACNTMPQKDANPESGYYETYDAKVDSLRLAVERGDLSVTEAEEQRKEAFQEYLHAVRDKRIELEYRNY